MSDEPTLTALEEARKIYDEYAKYVPCWFNTWFRMDYRRYLVGIIARAITAAELRGRIAGLREAADDCACNETLIRIRVLELEKSNAQ